IFVNRSMACWACACVKLFALKNSVAVDIRSPSSLSPSGRVNASYASGAPSCVPSPSFGPSVSGVAASVAGCPSVIGVGLASPSPELGLPAVGSVSVIARCLSVVAPLLGSTDGVSPHLRFTLRAGISNQVKPPARAVLLPDRAGLGHGVRAEWRCVNTSGLDEGPHKAAASGRLKDGLGVRVHLLDQPLDRRRLCLFV